MSAKWTDRVPLVARSFRLGVDAGADEFGLDVVCWDGLCCAPSLVCPQATDPGDDEMGSSVTSIISRSLRGANSSISSSSSLLTSRERGAVARFTRFLILDAAVEPLSDVPPATLSLRDGSRTTGS